MNETQYPNNFRQKLRNFEQLIGCWSSIGSPITAEMLGLAGFDWLLLDAEHAPNDELSLIPQLMALKESLSTPIVRVHSIDPVMIKRVLDLGFYNILVPFVETKEDAIKAVSATRYPPQGIRGVSLSHRGNAYATIQDYFKSANENITVIVQIENQHGLDNLVHILSVDGIDAVFVGPSDLAASLGHIGNINHPDVQSAIKQVFEKAKQFGKPSGILTGSEEDARRYISWGATLVAVGADVGLFRSATQHLAEKFINKN
ncbi:2-dehydro-3-deoxyglucarate aldolase [Vibrio sp. TH_r3]|uniref:2-dehydro-3-deoxyglucarate aldolase n=1 Tax=Vibrio sp. TH_r3 TaxID=3082084 RepID=UPI0029533F96|nr:2-dehydro-3-deoxyglucarate aldolase [Vibrio sp. TH_r3]MDV7105361.1 2-dehydro-3-deoxyglucarate aldolase [Vibrio sp. TH_r3]